MVQRTALVVGRTNSDADLDDLRSLAFDVADRLRFPARIAVGREYNVSEYEVVVLAGNFAETYESAVLGCEALSADMYVLWDIELKETPYSLQCAQCYEDDDTTRPRLAGDMWSVPMCTSCVDAARRMALPGTLRAAA
ncbi:hypothetical protein ABZX69_15980 [Streptomyces sp. NPDC004074]|uniref:hypothetical protein n=1 Tax=Streptomyces sp. NPDC004074 TaxID=3154277 RepID=UPI00339F87D3